MLRKQKKGLEKLPVEKRVSQPKVSTPCSGQPAVWMSASPRGSPRCGRPCPPGAARGVEVCVPPGQPAVWRSVSLRAACGMDVSVHLGPARGVDVCVPPGQPAVWTSVSPRGSPRCGRPCPTGQPVVWTSVSSWAARGVEVRAHPGQLWCGRLSTCLGLQEACLCRSLLSGGGLHPHCLELTHSGQHEAGWNRVRAPSYVRSEPPRCPALTHSSVPVAQVPPSPSTS